MLRILALVATLAGAGGSVGFMLLAGRHNPSILLLALFTIWVLSPFAAILVAYRLSLARVAVYCAALVISLVSLAIYGYVALGPPRAQTAFAFVVTPPASCLVLAIVVVIGWRSSDKVRSPR